MVFVRTSLCTYHDSPQSCYRALPPTDCRSSTTHPDHLGHNRRQRCLWDLLLLLRPVPVQSNLNFLESNHTGRVVHQPERNRSRDLRTFGRECGRGLDVWHPPNLLIVGCENEPPDQDLHCCHLGSWRHVSHEHVYYINSAQQSITDVHRKTVAAPQPSSESNTYPA